MLILETEFVVGVPFDDVDPLVVVFEFTPDEKDEETAIEVFDVVDG